jgi:peptide-methionine (R)-S-oxide reductase
VNKRCGCCGKPLFFAKSKYDAQTGWPAFHSPAVTNVTTNTSNVCSPGGTEVVCSHCGAHLGDYFPEDDHFCIDGVCTIPPESNKVCPPGTDRVSE